MKHCDLVDVFHGSGEVFWSEAEGIASTWQPIKALCGNTHPHASIPFGQFSCGAYSGGYSTGYGNHRQNSDRPPEKLMEKGLLKGFSHYHCSGTGALGIYYNYAVVTPFIGELSNAFELKKIKDESGFPSYYKAILENNISCEVTVNENCAYHRYKNNIEKKVAIDFSNNGLDKSLGEKFHSFSKESHLKIISKNEIQASVLMEGLTLYFYVICEDATVELFDEDTKILDTTELNLEEVKHKFGCVFHGTSDEMNLRVSFSLKSFDQAKEYCQKHMNFDECQQYTEKVWEKYLGAFEIEASDDEKKLFYSNLYQTLIKPSDFTGQSNLFDSNKPYVIGFETLWDQYKTQLPLIFMLYGEISEKIVNSYLNLGEAVGLLPHTLALTNNYNLEAVQACALPQHMMIDAYYRNVKFDDMDKFFSICYADMLRIEKKLFDENGKIRISTHLLDFSDAANGMSTVAKQENREDWAEKFSALHKDIAEVFDANTGLLSDKFSYYEGNHWNYSFRLSSEMDKRIKLAGGTEKFESLLDTFFGFTDPESRKTRFEGFNNETDMETPYAYHFIGKHDKISQILDLANKYMFFNGTGGIPGNNDTGGLSSLYVCNSIGIFPVTGQNLTIIGLPRHKQTKIKLANENTLTIKKVGSSIFVDKAFFNGEPLENLSIETSKLMSGGELEVIMK